MKKLALLTILAIFASFSISAQEVKDNQNKQKDKQVKEQTQLQKEKQNTQGQTVSQVAKETLSGPGKGEIVSSVASSKSEAKKASKIKGKKEKKAKAPKERQDNKNADIQKGPHNARPKASGNKAGMGGPKPGQGKK